MARPVDDRAARGAYGHEIWTRINEQGLREAGSIVDEIVAKEAGALSDELERGGCPASELQTRMSLGDDSREAALGGRRGPVREQFEGELRELTDAEQDSKELKSAKRNLLYDRIAGRCEAAVPRRRRRTGEQDSLTKSYVRKACDAIYKSLVRQQDRDRQAPAGRSHRRARSARSSAR